MNTLRERRGNELPWLWDRNARLCSCLISSENSHSLQESAIIGFNSVPKAASYLLSFWEEFIGHHINSHPEVRRSIFSLAL